VLNSFHAWRMVHAKREAKKATHLLAKVVLQHLEEVV
jgi:hypothetical protein